MSFTTISVIIHRTSTFTLSEATNTILIAFCVPLSFNNYSIYVQNMQAHRHMRRLCSIWPSSNTSSATYLISSISYLKEIEPLLVYFEGHKILVEVRLPCPKLFLDILKYNSFSEQYFRSQHYSQSLTYIDIEIYFSNPLFQIIPIQNYVCDKKSLQRNCKRAHFEYSDI